MKKEKKRFYNKMSNLHKVHPDDPLNERKIVNNYKKKKRILLKD